MKNLHRCQLDEKGTKWKNLELRLLKWANYELKMTQVTLSCKTARILKRKLKLNDLCYLVIKKKKNSNNIMTITSAKWIILIYHIELMCLWGKRKEDRTSFLAYPLTITTATLTIQLLHILNIYTKLEYSHFYF